MKDFQREVEEVCKRLNVNFIIQAHPIKIYAEICWDLSEEQYTWSWTKHVTYKGLEKAFIKGMEGFEVCRKMDATIHCIIGEKAECGSFIIGKHKNYWLKPTAQIE